MPKSICSRRRFHPVYSLAVLRRPALVLFLPLIQALEAFDLPGLARAVRQELVLLVFLLLLGLVLWRAAWWEQKDGLLRWHAGLFGFGFTRTVQAQQLSCLAIRRAWYLRPIGAVRLEFSLYTGETRHLFLTRKTALALADTLFPLPAEMRDLSPSWGDRAAMALLSCDLLTTFVLTALTLRNSAQIMGRDWTSAIAGQSLRTAAALAARWVPVGFAGLAALFFLLILSTLLLSAFRVARFSLRRGGGFLESTGGVFSPTLWRLREDCITCADLRLTPMARLLRRAPLYLSVGGYTGAPILVCRLGQEHTLCALLPELEIPRFTPLPKAALTGRSIPAFVLAPGLGLLGCGCVWLALRPRFAWSRPLSALGLFFFSVWLLVSVEGFFRDRLALALCGRVQVVSTRFFTHHLCFLFYTPAAVCLQNPFSRRVGRCGLSLCLPGRKALKLISVRMATVRRTLTRMKKDVNSPHVSNGDF